VSTKFTVVDVIFTPPKTAVFVALTVCDIPVACTGWSNRTALKDVNGIGVFPGLEPPPPPPPPPPIPPFPAHAVTKTTAIGTATIRVLRIAVFFLSVVN